MPASLPVMAVHMAVRRVIDHFVFEASKRISGRLRSHSPSCFRPRQSVVPRKLRLNVMHKARGARTDGMVIGMATRKVTITLDEAQLDQIRALVQAGTAASVSGFVQHAVTVALDDVAGWGAMLAEALRATGGELSNKERAWADEVLGTGTQPAA